MAQLKPQTPEDRWEMATIAALTIGNFALVAALCWWAWSFYDVEQVDTPFLVIMVPTVIYAAVTGPLLFRRLRRFDAYLRSSQGSDQ